MGWQYQHDGYCRVLEKAGIVQSMSRKGNCIDNGATEQVFGHMKDELFRGREWLCFENFKRDLDEYVVHWNTRRRQVKLKGLTPEEFRKLRAFAASLGLAVLCEAHTADELDMLLDGGAEIVGINARNLSTFDTSLALAGELIRQIPAGKIAVAESAIRSADDLNAMEQLGAKAFLIGETLMRAERPGEKLCELLSK